ncbi:hypothetical protein ASD42_10560 [Nocardia sp. Root136]|uniref:DUF6640 family protein n=1 Tax=Nocardia sp. Root136 TaxID=1736458 RepID=UPI0006F280ED|nr:DUF6640 family protein [Nocardia sp. Root136]KQY38779.1 hypothetical protein ASD42_10560 [Nocardia sp. Root136]
MTKTLSAPRALAVLVAVITVFGALLADFVIPAGAAQHLRNDAWPPHAKLHDAQYIVMSILLGVLALTLLLRRDGGTRSRLWTACAILATPWLGLLAAMLFPGTAVHDPEFADTTIIGLHPQVLLAVILLAVLVTAVALSTRRRN